MKKIFFLQRATEHRPLLVAVGFRSETQGMMARTSGASCARGKVVWSKSQVAGYLRHSCLGNSGGCYSATETGLGPSEQMLREEGPKGEIVLARQSRHGRRETVSDGGGCEASAGAGPEA